MGPNNYLPRLDPRIELNIRAQLIPGLQNKNVLTPTRESTRTEDVVGQLVFLVVLAPLRTFSYLCGRVRRMSALAHRRDITGGHSSIS